LLFGAGQVFNRTVGFFLLPFFTSVLNPQDYGVTALINLAIALAGGLFALGSGVSVGQRYFERDDAEHRGNVIWTSVAMLGVNAAVLLGGILVFSTNLSLLLFHSPEFAQHIQLAFFVLAVSTTVDPICILLRVTNRATTFVALTVVNTLLTASAGVLFVVILKRGLLGLYEAGALSVVMYASYDLFVGMQLIKPSFDRRHLLPLLRIGAPLVAPVLGWYVIEYCDRYLIERFIGLGEVGVYTVGYTFGAAILVVVNAFYGSWPGFFMPFMKMREESTILFGKVLTYYTFGVGSLCLILFLAAKPLVFVMTADSFHAAYTVVGLIACAYFLKGLYLILLPGLVFAAKTRLQAIIELSAAALNVGLNLLLIPLFHKEGAAAATVLAFVWMCALGWRYSGKELPVVYEWDRLARFGVTFIAFVGLSFLSLPSLSLTILMHALYLVLFMIACRQFVLTVSERAALTQFLPTKLTWVVRP